MELVQIYLNLFNKITITTNFLEFFSFFPLKFFTPGSRNQERKRMRIQDPQACRKTLFVSGQLSAAIPIGRPESMVGELTAVGSCCCCCEASWDGRLTNTFCT